MAALAVPAAATPPLLPNLPLPRELSSLLARHAELAVKLEQHRDLLGQLASVRQARESGNGKMHVPVDLGRGYMIEGVVKDTSKVFVMGLDDVWLQLEVDKAEEFVERKMEILQKRADALDEPIAKLQKDYALVTKTLNAALALPDTE
ncbi:hypothetical protein RQP46_006015 [Phenoliferia psychrophenolica]